jgi:hypothetical protein
MVFMTHVCHEVRFRHHGFRKAGAVAGLLFDDPADATSRAAPGPNVVAETGWRGRFTKLEAGAGGRTGGFYSFRAKIVFF